VGAPDIELEVRPLLVAAQKGDAVAYRRFLSLISVRLRGMIRAQLARAGRRDLASVEDVLQETLLAIHLSQHTYDPSSPVTAWAHAIARYKVIDYLRASGRTAGSVPLDDADQIADAQDEATSVDTGIDLAKALDALPPKVRQLVHDVKLQGLTIAEASARSGLSESAVKVALHRALKRMAKLLRAGRGESFQNAL
jgi:RNA polymerase sigma-70 factor (ECF subfamily)